MNSSIPLFEPRLPEAHLHRLTQISHLYTQQVLQNRVVYPPPPPLSRIVVKKHRNRTTGKFAPAIRPTDLATIAFEEVQHALIGLNPVDGTGDLILGEHNFEYLTEEKAAYFEKVYRLILERHDLLFCCEVSAQGMQRVANDNPDYLAFWSAENNRGQAVGFFLNKNRLEVSGEPISYDEVASVQGLPNLRPDLRLNLIDKLTDEEFAAIVRHRKSMRGGAIVTSPVRIAQDVRLIRLLESNFRGVMGGDFNSFLDYGKDIEALLAAGFSLVGPHDNTATQSLGGRLDGFLVKDFELVHLRVRNFWRSARLGRQLSDHGLLTVRRRYRKETQLPAAA